MNRFRRIEETAAGIIMIVAAIVMLAAPKEGYPLIIAILSVAFAARGIRQLIFYFTMARFMVGGRMTLYTGIILLDFGVFTGTLTDVPHIYVLLYLVAINAFSGMVEVLRALESRRYGSGWRLKMSHGVLNILMAVACFVFIKQAGTAVIIYGIGLVYSSVMRIISAWRKTKFVYIQ